MSISSEIYEARQDVGDWFAGLKTSNITSCQIYESSLWVFMQSWSTTLSILNFNTSKSQLFWSYIDIFLNITIVYMHIVLQGCSGLFDTSSIVLERLVKKFTRKSSLQTTKGLKQPELALTFTASVSSCS